MRHVLQYTVHYTVLYSLEWYNSFSWISKTDTHTVAVDQVYFFINSISKNLRALTNPYFFDNLHNPSPSKNTCTKQKSENTEEKAKKVVAAVWGTEFIQFLDALKFCIRMILRIGWTHTFLQIILVQFILFFNFS